jgi:hypothetical protein
VYLWGICWRVWIRPNRSVQAFPFFFSSLTVYGIPNSGYWFSGPQDVNFFRQKLASLCPSHENSILLQSHQEIVVPFSLSSPPQEGDNNQTLIDIISSKVESENSSVSSPIEESPSPNHTHTHPPHSGHPSHPIRNHHRMNHSSGVQINSTQNGSLIH